MRSPILLIIFNRPAETKRTFAAIRKARPPRLYVAADGPRPHKPDDAALCREARAVIDGVDWDCEVFTLFRDENKRGPVGIPEAIDWFFSHEEEGVILEDDILAHPDFFMFCDAMLEKYRYEERVLHITGNNFQLGLMHGDGSYYFSKLAHCWGWASWARAWKIYERRLEMDDLTAFFSGDMLRICHPDELGSLVPLMFNCLGDREGHWDVRWIYTVRQKGFAVVPNVPLTQNFGYGNAATHTKDFCLLNLIVPKSMGDIIHPEKMEWNAYADKVNYRIYFSRGGAWSPTKLKEEIACRIQENAPQEAIEAVAALQGKLLRTTNQLRASHS